MIVQPEDRPSSLFKEVTLAFVRSSLAVIAAIILAFGCFYAFVVLTHFPLPPGHPYYGWSSDPIPVELRLDRSLVLKIPKTYLTLCSNCGGDQSIVAIDVSYPSMKPLSTTSRSRDAEDALHISVYANTTGANNDVAGSIERHIRGDWTRVGSFADAKGEPFGIYVNNRDTKKWAEGRPLLTFYWVPDDFKREPVYFDCLSATLALLDGFRVKDSR